MNKVAYEFNKKLGRIIQKRMENLGITTKELAKHLGITRQALESYFSGIAKPPVDKLVLLAEKLQCSTDYLLDIEPRGIQSPWLLCSEKAPNPEDMPILYVTAQHPTPRIARGLVWENVERNKEKVTLFVTAKDDVDIMEKLITKLFDPYPEGEEEVYIDAFRELFQIVAWMPLPKFYDKPSVERDHR